MKKICKHTVEMFEDLDKCPNCKVSFRFEDNMKGSDDWHGELVVCLCCKIEIFENFKYCPFCGEVNLMESLSIKTPEEAFEEIKR